MSDPFTGVVGKGTEIAAKALAKDVYADVAQPGAREFGRLLALGPRLVNLILMPLHVLANSGERMQRELEERLAERLKDVPADKQVPASPLIAGALLAHYPFIESEPSLRELFEQLLASAVQVDKQHLVHPSFVEVLRQLSPDEGKIVQCLARKGTHIPLIAVRRRIPGTGYIDIGDCVDLWEASDLTHPELANTYIGNLIRLGILERNLLTFVVKADDQYQKLQEEVKRQSPDIPEEELQLVRGILRILPFGHHFIACCVHGFGERPPSPPQPDEA